MKTVVFDLGKVLIAYEWEAYLASFRYSRETYEAVADAVFRSDSWEKGDEGAPPDEWLDMFVENAPAYENEIKRVYERLEECVWMYEYTPKLLRKYRESGYQIYYLSNYSEYLYEKSLDTLSFLKDFDGGIFSFREKCIKPGTAIFQKLIDKYHINPAETFFFDDRKDNVDTSLELGFKGIVFSEEAALKALHSGKKAL